MKEEVFFSYSFCIEIHNKRKTQFNVQYYRIGGNKYPYFSTNCDVMNYVRSDINMGGQCQKAVLPKNTLAFRFFEKWDKKHLQQLNEDEMNEVLADIEELKNKYDYVGIVNGDRTVDFNKEVALQRKDTKTLEHDKSILKCMDYKIHNAK